MNCQKNPVEFPAKLEHLYQMLKYIKESATLAGFTKTLISKIELASEEALVNIINHGFPKKSGTISIHCLESEMQNFSIIIEDNGIAFNPLESTKKFDPASLLGGDDSEDPQLGGYGIYFIINMMDSVDYRYSDGKNVLTLTKRKS